MQADKGPLYGMGKQHHLDKQPRPPTVRDGLCTTVSVPLGCGGFQL